jgi:hypothetical protein
MSSSEDINTQRVLNAVKKCILTSCKKVPYQKDFNEIKKRLVATLGAMEQWGVISSSDVRIIEDTPAEKLVREIMEEEEESEIKVEMILHPSFPITYLNTTIKVD